MPELLHPQDPKVWILRSCICGSDLHFYDGLVPDTRVGSTFGHKFIGEVVKVGDAYHLFSSKLDNCIKTVLIPPMAST
ncbi:MAG: alcohol dehydrogenase catalytic domain-containing protein [Sphingobacterium sp.]|uniref:alcohol dehydrogenase catalytic domain-containing protein n=1 Tax=Sphingobacterium sp. TaxID=341027 RepID=UPI002851A0FC|nr:alcohol dehydrogenase catalytic domain-containing protein [Sphingobacterium sp.]MDR3007152.1 alcohol dehydrogenase catalytic domain-containing protein [Sphingobacterium sp.]